MMQHFWDIHILLTAGEKVTADLVFITNSVNLSKIKPVATELSRTYDPIAAGRKVSYQTIGNLQEFSTDSSASVTTNNSIFSSEIDVTRYELKKMFSLQENIINLKVLAGDMHSIAANRNNKANFWSNKSRSDGQEGDRQQDRINRKQLDQVQSITS
ncbi:cadherin-related family member 4-like [Limosa lapponica baueri]|uniref:Cadherin-related family member 4-like n=1 Tax=Limosa lapponica baueri TaxID=1758121 RepID=A0A2I0UCH4_LIMLA|nr:cadherin-related family member 4-like [Limosa lapponica baueri]